VDAQIPAKATPGKSPDPEEEEDEIVAPVRPTKPVQPARNARGTEIKKPQV